MPQIVDLILSSLFASLALQVSLSLFSLGVIVCSFQEHFKFSFPRMPASLRTFSITPSFDRGYAATEPIDYFCWGLQILSSFYQEFFVEVVILSTRSKFLDFLWRYFEFWLARNWLWSYRILNSHFQIKQFVFTVPPCVSILRLWPSKSHFPQPSW